MAQCTFQTIGDPQRYFNFELLANHTQVDMINNINAQGGRLKVIIDGDYYEGYCNTADWQRITRHLEESDRYYYSSKENSLFGKVGWSLMRSYPTIHTRQNNKHKQYITQNPPCHCDYKGRSS